ILDSTAFIGTIFPVAVGFAEGIGRSEREPVGVAPLEFDLQAVIEAVSVGAVVADRAERLHTLLGLRRVINRRESPSRLEVRVRRGLGLIEYAVVVGHVRVLAAYVADRQRGRIRQLALDVEAPLPDVAVLAVG